MPLYDAKEAATKQRLPRSGLWRMGSIACSAVLGCFSSILVARALGPGAFGSYTLVLWLATLMIPAIGAGMSTLSSRRVAEIQGRKFPRMAAGIFYFLWRRQSGRILLYYLLYTLLIFPSAWFFGARAPLPLWLLAGLSAPPLLLSGVISIALRSLRRFDLIAILQLFSTLSTLLLTLLAIQLRRDLIVVLLLVSASSGVLTLLVALLCVVRLLPMDHPLPPGPFLRGCLARELNNSLLLFTLDAIVWQRSELLVLAHWRSPVELGCYALAALIGAWIMDIPPALFSIYIARLLRYLPGYVNAGDSFLKTTLYLLLLTTPVYGFFMLFCPTIIAYCFGSAYLPAVTPLRILLISSAFGSISTVSMTQLANSERKRAQVWLGTFTAILHIVLVFPCIMVWGIAGAALATAMPRLVSAIGSILICKGLTDP